MKLRIATPALVGALGLCASVPMGAASAAVPTPPAFYPCAFGRAEIATALGMEVKLNEAADMKTPGGREVGCIYSFTGSSLVLSLRLTWPAPPAASGANSGKWEHGARAIVGDPDGAAWKVAGAGDEQSVDLTYTRAGVAVHLSAHGTTFDVTDFQQRLLNLRRVP